MQPNYLIELDEQNFQTTLERSRETLTLVYFWAEMSAESVEIKKTLTAIADEYQGAFILANIDYEKQQMLAAQFPIQTLPSFILVSQGQIVDGLAGPQDEASIRQWLSPHLPSQDEIAFKAALNLIQESKFNQALTQLKSLEATLSALGEFKLALAECYIETSQYDQAQDVLSTVLMQDQNAQFKSLLAKVELHKQAADSDEIRSLQQDFANNPDNDQLGFELAIQLSQVNQQEQALNILLNILKKDLNFADGEAKKTTMDILAALGQGNEIASRYRRKLYALLY